MKPFSTLFHFCTPSPLSLAQANRHHYAICSPCLYRYNVERGSSSALNWAAENGRMEPIVKALEAGAPLPPYPTPGKTKHGPVVTVNGSEIDERLYQNLQTHPSLSRCQGRPGGHEVMVEFMINGGVLIDLRDPEGFTLLALRR